MALSVTFIHWALDAGSWPGGDYFIKSKRHGWGEIDRGDAVCLIHKALDGGIQFFDTAASYGKGLSEEILGEGIHTSASGYHAVICTKISLTEREIKDGNIGRNFEIKVEKSLKRLRIDRIDVLLIHNPPDELNWREFDTRILDDLRKKGKIGTFGTSCRSLHGVKNVIRYNFGTCLQWVFNLLERRPAEEIFPVLIDKKMNFIARSPLASGLLSSKYLYQEPEFKSQEFRSKLPEDWIGWVMDEIRKIEQLNIISSTLSALAIRYCLSFDEMSVVIPGIRKKKYLKEFLLASEKGKISRNLISSINSKVEKNYRNWV